MIDLRCPRDLRDATRAPWRWTGAIVALLIAACAPREAAVPVREGMLPLATGDSLWYSVRGSGPDTIVAVPGGPAFSHAYLTDALGSLASSHTLVLYDPRGRGRSTAVNAAAPGISSQTDATDLLTLLDSLGLGRPALLAHHAGSDVVTRLAILAPARVGRTVFVAPELPHGVAIYDLASEVMDTAATARLAADYRDSLHTRDELAYCRRHWGFGLAPIEELDSRTVMALADSVCDGTAATRNAMSAIKSSIATARGINFHLADSMQTYPSPLLVLQGNRDRIYLFWSRMYAARAPDARMLELPGSPLFPWLESRRTFLDALEAFYAGAWPTGAVTPPFVTTRPAIDSILPLAPAL